MNGIPLSAALIKTPISIKTLDSLFIALSFL